MLASEWVPTLGIVVAAGIASTGGFLAFITARRAADVQRRDTQQIRIDKQDARIEDLLEDRALLINYGQELRGDILDHKTDPLRPWPTKIF